MSAKTRVITQLDLADATVLERLVERGIETIRPEMARNLIEYQFNGARQRRMKVLSKKAQSGALTLVEQRELDEYIRIGSLLGILQSRARRILSNVEQAP